MIKKQKIHILPLFIFIAVLTLTIKVNTVFDIYNQQNRQAVTVSAAQALAEEKINRETKELTAVLEKNAQSGPTGVKKGSSAFTQSEIMILQELAERREALDLRAQEIDKRAIQLKVTEDEIERKLRQLQDYEQRLNKLINEYTQKEQANIDSLVRLYSSMKPKDAARIFNSLDMSITVALLKGMKASASSAILSQMDSAKAQAVTSELIGNNI
ncbi:MAG: hypothetical protein IJ482_00305 [Alphaproteobacteria bacterium]|nr:hypothetical protein [Alphaproteobacteria bacterium]